MAAKRDYYEVLGVEQGASPDELKRAYRRLARELHPDVNQEDPHAEEHFKELGEAYEVLSDAQKRAIYDRYGHAGLDSAAGMGGHAGNPFGDVDSIFESFFGGMGRGQQQPDRRGGDRRVDVDISLEEAAVGIDRTVRVSHYVPCGTCNSRGSEGRGPVKCPACAGMGQVRSTAGFLGMQFTQVVPCERCGGTGEIVTDPCRTCQGQGRVAGTEELSVHIPAGSESGLRIRYSSRGDSGLRGAPAGDLYVNITVRRHRVFERHGHDLACEVKLPFTTAALGGKLHIPTLNGEHELTIPPATATGHVFRIRGEGMPALNTTARGDLHVVVTVDVPTDLPHRQQELLRELAAERGENVEYHRKSVFRRVADAVTEVVDDYKDRTKEAFGG